MRLSLTRKGSHLGFILYVQLICTLNASASTRERLEDYPTLHAKVLKFCSQSRRVYFIKIFYDAQSKDVCEDMCHASPQR